VTLSETTFDLQHFLATEREEVERALQRALDTLLPMLDPELVEPARHALFTGGKRLRPILCVAGYRAAGGEPVGAAYDLGVALELIHAYSLMHDDLPCMDDAELRRGKPTPHTLFGEGPTTRAGVALIPCASIQAMRAARGLGCDEPGVRRIVAELNQAAGAGGMVGGQALDLLGEGRTLSSEELDGLHRRKTGALLTASLVIGGLAAGAPVRVLEGLERYGRAVGLAFQVADDLLDATATAEALGKKPSDAQLDKSTYVSLYGLEEAACRAQALADEAVEALVSAQIEAPALSALSRYVVERKR
jgi:geranylgeranyl pyrophosphate synthase